MLVLGGRYDEGDQVLRSLISEYKEPVPEATDRILQVLFDHANIGGFDGSFTETRRMNTLRAALLDAAPQRARK